MNRVVIQTEDFDVNREYRRLREASNGGAIVFFVGLVRDLYQPDSDDHVDRIVLQHYPQMTEQMCEQVIDEACERYPLSAVRVVHRVGQLDAGEQIVMVATASDHRHNAFNAAEFIMDYLKTRATIWKKEVGSRGENWVGMKQSDQQAARRWAPK